MNHQRTGGMTAIGILNIVFGSIGSLAALLALLFGGLLAAGGAVLDAESAGTGGEGVGGMVAAGGMLVMVVGLVGLVCWGLLVVAGIGVLRLRPIGRTLSIACGGGIALLSGYSIVNGDFGIMNLGMCGYGLVLVGLFLQPPWKAAFAGEDLTAGLEFTETDRAAIREAA